MKGMGARWGRILGATALTVAVAGTGVLFGGGTAAAATPIVVGSCATTIQGAPGTPVELAPAAVTEPITNLIKAVPLLGPPLAAPFVTAFDALPPIPVGALPTGKGVITGGQIANAVVAQLKKLPLLGPILGTLVGGVQSTLTSLCGITVTGVNQVVAPVQNGTGGLATASQQATQQLLGGGSGGGASQGGSPGAGSGGGAGATGPTGGGSGGSTQTGPGLPQPNSPVLGGLSLSGDDATFGAAQLLDYGLATSPADRYSGIPYADAGLFAPAPGVRYGGNVPGYAPQYGVLGQSGQIPGDGVTTAGHAEALGAAAAGGNGIGLPMLLAVLALSGVTAALVRTWVLRRVPS
jgi:hypothetical protein